LAVHSLKKTIYAEPDIGNGAASMPCSDIRSFQLRLTLCVDMNDQLFLTALSPRTDDDRSEVSATSRIFAVMRVGS